MLLVIVRLYMRHAISSTDLKKYIKKAKICELCVRNQLLTSSRAKLLIPAGHIFITIVHISFKKWRSRFIILHHVQCNQFQKSIQWPVKIIDHNFGHGKWPHLSTASISPLSSCSCLVRSIIKSRLNPGTPTPVPMRKREDGLLSSY